jgi:hypothetical protein
LNSNSIHQQCGAAHPRTEVLLLTSPVLLLHCRGPQLQAGLCDWLHWLQHDVGFEGWRFDYARG